MTKTKLFKAVNAGHVRLLQCQLNWVSFTKENALFECHNYSLSNEKNNIEIKIKVNEMKCVGKAMNSNIEADRLILGFLLQFGL